MGEERENSQKQVALQHRIEATDRQIDALVYELYGLTEEEIGVVQFRLGAGEVLQGG